MGLTALKMLGALSVTLAMTFTFAAPGAAAPDPSPSTAPHDVAAPNVMFLGDSITGSPGCWRATIWQTLSNAGHRFHAVGPRKPEECGEVRDAAGNVWEANNAGYPGLTTHAATSKITLAGLLTRSQPDIIVMLLGTNDVWTGADVDEVITQYQVLLIQMREYDPEITLLIGTMLPMAKTRCPTCNATIDQLNPRILAWAEKVTTAKSPVTAVVLDAGFDSGTDTYDGVHPNDSGNAKIAAAWTPAIEAALADYSPRQTGPSSVPPGIWLALLLPILLFGLTLRMRTRPTSRRT